MACHHRSRLGYGVAVLGVCGLLLGCEQEGPAEELGEAVDETTEETGEALEEAGEEAQEQQ